MSGSGEMFFSAAKIAKALGVHKKTIHRRALKEGWKWRRVGNRYEYSPPASLLKYVLELQCPGETESKPKRIDVRFDDDLGCLQRDKALLKEEAVRALCCLLDHGEPKELALKKVCKEMTRKHPGMAISSGSLRRWEPAYARDGIDGLVEQKRGRVGRKPKKLSASKANDAEGKRWVKLGVCAIHSSSLLICDASYVIGSPSPPGVLGDWESFLKEISESEYKQLLYTRGGIGAGMHIDFSERHSLTVEGLLDKKGKVQEIRIRRSSD